MSEEVETQFYTARLPGVTSYSSTMLAWLAWPGSRALYKVGNSSSVALYVTDVLSRRVMLVLTMMMMMMRRRRVMSADEEPAVQRRVSCLLVGRLFRPLFHVFAQDFYLRCN